MLTGIGYQGYETSYTSYGAGGGTGGGGFVPGEGGSQQSPGGRRDYAQDSMRPVTIKQLLEATIEGEKDTCRIDNSLVTQVCRYYTLARTPLTIAVHTRWPNTQHFCTDYKHHISPRRRYRQYRGQEMGQPGRKRPAKLRRCKVD